MFSSSYSAKFDRAAEVCFYIMFKVRCHYFIQEINLLHKKGRPNKSILHCISNFLWRKRGRCVHVGYSGHKTAEMLLIFSIIYNEIVYMTLSSDTAAVSLLKGLLFKAAFHWPDRSGWSCWSAQWNATFRRIGSSGTSQNGDPNWSNMADALATYWRRVSIWITAAVSNCVAKMMQFLVNLISFYRNRLHSYDVLLSFQSTDISDLVQSACVLYISW